MSLTLTKAIEQCPRSWFGDKNQGIPPKYKKITASVVKALLTDKGEKFSEKTVELVFETVNVSSMQRAISSQREFLEKGGVKPPKKERGKPRPKADELGLDKPKKAGKKTGYAGYKAASKKAKGAVKPAQKAASKPAKVPEAKKAAEGKVDAVAAARARLAAKKAIEAGKAKAASKAAPKEEETVEI